MPLIVCAGTPGAGWESIAQQLTQSGLDKIECNAQDLPEKANNQSGVIYNLSVEDVVNSPAPAKDILYIFFVSQPALALASRISDSNSGSVVMDAYLEEWQQTTEQMLAFIQENANSILVSTTDTSTHYSNFLAVVNKKAGLSLENRAEPLTIELDTATVFGAQKALERHYELEELYQDALLQISLLSSIEFINEQEQVTLDDFIKNASIVPKYEKELELKQQQLVRQNEQTKALEQSLKSESELALLQIHQLQEELESHYKQLQTEKQKSQSSASELQDMKAQYAQLQEQEQSLKSESELALLQINQLQEELEQSFTKLQTEQKRAKNSDQQVQLKEKTIQANKEKIAELEAESELALLQIHQLQEELEHYYIKFMDLKIKAKDVAPKSYAKTKSNRAFQAAFASRLVVNELYSEHSYEHLELTLKQLNLVDGRKLDAVQMKLVNNSGCYGLEFRKASRGHQTHLLNSWPEQQTDEHGQKLVFYPVPSAHFAQEQQEVQSLLNASDRLLVLSAAKCLTEMFESGQTDHAALKGSELSHWKTIARDLEHQVESMPDWMSFDQVRLKEESRADGYEHLWISVKNLLVNDRFFPEYEFKICASELQDAPLFAKHFVLEFREFESNTSPLQCWPPTTEDEWGPYARVSLPLSVLGLTDAGCTEFTEQDKQLTNLIVANLASVFEKLSFSGNYPTERAWEEWIAVGQKLKKIHTASLVATTIKRAKRLIKALLPGNK